MKKSIKTLLVAIVVTSASCIFNPLTTDAYAEIGMPLTQPETGWTRYDDTNTNISYLGNVWDNHTYKEYYNATEKVANTKGDFLTFKFQGSKFRLISSVTRPNRNCTYSDPQYDVGEVYIDDKYVGKFDEMRRFDNVSTRQNLVFEYDTNNYKTHKVKIVKRIANFGLFIDAIDTDGKLINKSTSQNQQSIVEYQTHISKDGWLPWVRNDKVSGTTGQAKQIEAIRIKLLPPYNKMNNLHVEYRAHVAEYGWLPWVRDGKIAGTTGQARRVEAFQVRIVDNNGNIRKDYNIGSKYVHVAKDGWIPGNVNGGTIGTTGQSKRIEAFDLYCYHMK